MIIGEGIIGKLWERIMKNKGNRRVKVSEKKEERRKIKKNLENGFEIIKNDEMKDKKVKEKSWGVEIVIE
jgi:threonine dehydrogenase-like Zn-dependent dehydrogenase